MKFSNIKTAFAVIVVSGFLVYGCENDYPVGPIGPNHSYYYPNNNNNNNNNYNNSQSLEFKNEDGFHGYLNQGTYLHIVPNTFVDNSGSMINGRVTLTINEIYKKSDMFLSAISTVSDTSLLQSGGMLYISATHDNNTASLKSGSSIFASFPVTGTPLKMQFFNGITSPSGYTSWQLNSDTVHNNIVLKKDSTGKTGYYYEMNSSGLNWLNCDYINQQSPVTTIRVKVANGALFSGITCALVYQINSETLMNPDTGTNNFKINGAPVGLKATIVVSAQKYNTTFAAFIPVTITGNMIQTVTVTEMDDNTFRSKLKSLD